MTFVGDETNNVIRVLMETTDISKATLDLIRLVMKENEILKAEIENLKDQCAVMEEEIRRGRRNVKPKNPPADPPLVRIRRPLAEIPLDDPRICGKHTRRQMSPPLTSDQRW